MQNNSGMSIIIEVENETHLEVQVLQTSHGGAADSINHLETGEVSVGADNDGVESDFILEAVDVVSGVGVDVLERLCELVIQAINKSDQRSLDEKSLTLLGDTILVSLLILLGDVLLNGVVLVLLQDVQQLVQVLVGARLCSFKKATY